MHLHLFYTQHGIIGSLVQYNANSLNFGQKWLKTVLCHVVNMLIGD